MSLGSPLRIGVTRTTLRVWGNIPKEKQSLTRIDKILDKAGAPSFTNLANILSEPADFLEEKTIDNF